MTNLDYLYNPEAARERFDKNYFIDKKLGFQVIKNGTILPYKDDGHGGLIGALGGIVDSNGNYFPSSFVSNSRNRHYTPPNRFNTARKRLSISDTFFMFGDTSLPTTFVACGF